MIQKAFKRTLAFGLLLLVVIAPIAAQDWAGKARVSGQIRDENDQPVAGATVTLRQDVDDPTSGPDPFVIKKPGRWSFLGLDGGIWAIKVEAEGYLPTHGQFQANPFQPTVVPTIILDRSPSASIDEGDALIEAQDFAGARAKYLEAIPALGEEGQAQVHARIAKTYLQEKNFSAARSEYQQALAGFDAAGQGLVHVQIGNSYQLEGNYPAARAAYEKAMPLVDQAVQVDLLLTIARGYDMEGNRQAAIESLKKALEISPGHQDLIQVLADLLTREGLEEEAREYLAQLPDDVALPADMVLNIGIRLYNEGNMAEAKEYFDRAVADNPNLSDAYYYRGLTHLSEGENDLALADFKKLMELDPENEHQQEVTEFMEFLETGG